MKTEQKAQRSSFKIMAGLIVLLGSLAYIVVLAVINGSLGFLTAMGVTVFGSFGVVKALGEPVALSYGWIIGLTIGCGLIRGGLRYFEQYSNHYIAFRLLAVLRNKIFGALRRLCPAKLENKQKGSIIAMITADIETLEVFYAHTISPVCIAVLVSLTVFLGLGFGIHWYLALVALAGYLVIGIVIPACSSKKLQESGTRYRAEFASFNAYFLDSIKGVRDIVLNNAGDRRVEEVNQRSGELLAETKKMKHRTVRVGAVTELCITLFVAAAIVVGVLLVSSGELSLGKMIVATVAIFGSFGPVLAVSALPGNLSQTFAGGERVLSLLEEKPAVEEVTDGKCIDFAELQVKDLAFSYDGQQKVLEDVQMHVQKGEIVGIVGDSGCGKSTFLKLLLRFWQKDKGAIDYDGTDVDAVETASLLQNVTMVSQSTYLFHDTIAENLRIAKPDATQSELEEACRMASVHDFIVSLPNGYETQIAALGDNLSAGEKQRIGLARAFLRGSSLILFDEPTSNVDSINEGMILSAMKRQKDKKGIILVSHRESTMAIADRVYRMQNGKMEPVK